MSILGLAARGRAVARRSRARARRGGGERETWLPQLASHCSLGFRSAASEYTSPWAAATVGRAVAAARFAVGAASGSRPTAPRLRRRAPRTMPPNRRPRRRRARSRSLQRPGETPRASLSVGFPNSMSAELLDRHERWRIARMVTFLRSTENAVRVASVTCSTPLARGLGSTGSLKNCPGGRAVGGESQNEFGFPGEFVNS